jgi:hypothetical protein
MTTAFRNSRVHREYLSRVAESGTLGWDDGVLMPDITTVLPRGPLPRDLALREPPLEIHEAVRRDPAAPMSTSVVEERHPEIAKAITLLWGHPEMNEYFDRLWMADGGQGPIDPDAMSELMLLSRVHQEIVPERRVRTMADIYGAGRRIGGDRDHLDRRAPRADPWSAVPTRR